jgi:hypothetical protein
MVAVDRRQEAPVFRRLLIILAVSFFAAAAQTQAEPTAPTQSARSEELLGRMVGRWVLTGVIARQATTHDVAGAWVLQDKYVRLTETSREKGPDGRPQYEAVILVGWLKDHYVCFWFDNTEVASGEVTCSARVADDAIPFEFRDAKGALMFTNTFTYDRSSDAWRWRLDNVGPGGVSTFGDVVLRHR